MNTRIEGLASLLDTTTLLWLDRDGVINPLVPSPDLPGQAGYGPKQEREVSLVYPGAVALLKAAASRNIPIVIGSNQGPLHARDEFPSVPINPYQKSTLWEHPHFYQRFECFMAHHHIALEDLPLEASRYSEWHALTWSEHLAIHRKIMHLLREQGVCTEELCVLYCPHATKAGCSCRKPKTGLFSQAQCLLPLGTSQSQSVLVVGDSLGDWEFAQGLLDQGIHTRFVLATTGNYQRTQQQLLHEGREYELFLNTSHYL